MKTEDVDNTRPSKWIPETDPVTLAVLGKLAEECGELIAIIARCIIQGTDGADPETGQVNTSTLTDEIADVLALIDLATNVLKLDNGVIVTRAIKKYSMKADWLEMLK